VVKVPAACKVNGSSLRVLFCYFVTFHFQLIYGFNPLFCGSVRVSRVRDGSALGLVLQFMVSFYVYSLDIQIAPGKQIRVLAKYIIDTRLQYEDATEEEDSGRILGRMPSRTFLACAPVRHVSWLGASAVSVT